MTVSDIAGGCGTMGADDAVGDAGSEGTTVGGVLDDATESEGGETLEASSVVPFRLSQSAHFKS